MDLGAVTTGFILTAIFLFGVVSFGLLIMFSKASNIERPVLVGLMTLATALVAVALLAFSERLGLRAQTSTYVSIALLSMLGYAVGRFVDYIMGPQKDTPEEAAPTLGADWAD